MHLPFYTEKRAHKHWKQLGNNTPQVLGLANMAKQQPAVCASGGGVCRSPRGASHLKTQRRKTVPPPQFLEGRNPGHTWRPRPWVCRPPLNTSPLQPLPHQPLHRAARGPGKQPPTMSRSRHKCTRRTGRRSPTSPPHSPGGLSTPRPHEGRAPVVGHLGAARHKHEVSVDSPCCKATASPAHLSFTKSLRPGRIHTVFASRTITLPSRKMKGEANRTC